MEYDIIMFWKAGLEHVLPDALSRLPHSAEPQEDVDDSFPDDTNSKAPSDYVGLQGPTLEGVRVVDMKTFSPEEKDMVMTDETDAPTITALQALPFASSAAIEAQPTGLGRSPRKRVPSVDLCRRARHRSLCRSRRGQVARPTPRLKWILWSPRPARPRLW